MVAAIETAGCVVHDGILISNVQESRLDPEPAIGTLNSIVMYGAVSGGVAVSLPQGATGWMPTGANCSTQ